MSLGRDLFEQDPGLLATLQDRTWNRKEAKFNFTSYIANIDPSVEKEIISEEGNQTKVTYHYRS